MTFHAKRLPPGWRVSGITHWLTIGGEPAGSLVRVVVVDTGEHSVTVEADDAGAALDLALRYIAVIDGEGAAEERAGVAESIDPGGAHRRAGHSNGAL